MTPDRASAVQSSLVAAYRVGQRVFGRHGATSEYFHGYVSAAEPDERFPYTVDVGDGVEILVLDREIESDLPAPAATHEDLVDWLLSE